MPQDLKNKTPEAPTAVPDNGDAGPADPSKPDDEPTSPKEIGGRPGPDPTRYGDWEKNGRCIDF